MARRFTARRLRELRAIGATLNPSQPNRGRHECMGCKLVFGSEAGFTFHQRMMGPRTLTVCLTEKQLRRFKFVGNGRSFRCPAWVEYWYIDELDKELKSAGAGFKKEAWIA